MGSIWAAELCLHQLDMKVITGRHEKAGDEVEDAPVYNWGFMAKSSKKKSLSKKPETLVPTEIVDTTVLLGDLRELIEEARERTAAAFNAELVLP